MRFYQSIRFSPLPYVAPDPSEIRSSVHLICRATFVTITDCVFARINVKRANLSVCIVRSYQSLAIPAISPKFSMFEAGIRLDLVHSNCAVSEPCDRGELLEDGTGEKSCVVLLFKFLPTPNLFTCCAEFTFPTPSAIRLSNNIRCEVNVGEICRKYRCPLNRGDACTRGSQYALRAQQLRGPEQLCTVLGYISVYG